MAGLGPDLSCLAGLYTNINTNFYVWQWAAWLRMGTEDNVRSVVGLGLAMLVTASGPSPLRLGSGDWFNKEKGWELWETRAESFMLWWSEKKHFPQSANCVMPQFKQTQKLGYISLHNEGAVISEVAILKLQCRVQRRKFQMRKKRFKQISYFCHMKTQTCKIVKCSSEFELLQFILNILIT